MECSSPLPLDRVSVTPSNFIIPPQQIKDLLLVYHTNETDESHCSSYPALLACVKLTTGDEILRQRLQTVVTRKCIDSSANLPKDGARKEGTSLKLKNATNKVYLAYFSEQEAVATG